MRFTHGIWEAREHTVLYDAVEVASVSQPTANKLRALCATRHVQHRGNTLNRPTITVELEAVAPGIIACSATHFKGINSKSEARFELFPDGKPQIEAKVVRDDEAKMSTLSSEEMDALVDMNPSHFRVNFQSVQGKSKKILTSLGYQGVQYVVAPQSAPMPSPLEATTKIGDTYHRSPSAQGSRPHMVVSLDLQVGELVYGLGERFGPLTKNGQQIDLWNEDAGTCTPHTYKNIPFYMTNRGYGVFFDHSDIISMEIQTEKLAKVQASVQGEQIRWFIINGPSPKQVLKKYASLTGHPSLPPAWSFGLYLSTSFLTDYSEKTVNEQLDGMVKRNIPLSVLHFDCFWMRSHTWTSFVFDPQHFPDPKKFLDRLHERGVKVCVWINPYIAQESEVFDEAMEKGYLIKKVDDSVWQSDNWQAGMGVVDFTNPDARKWYKDQLTRLLDLGVDTFKTDFGERIPWENVKYYDGMAPRAGHNYYAYLYNRVVFEAIVERRGLDQAAVFARAATAGSQRLPVHWGGDCESTWPGMSQSLRGGISLGLSGFGFWSHDIAGFIAEGIDDDSAPDPHIYKRWVQWGLLSSHSRLHGSHSYRVPWLVDEEACEVLSKFSRLKNSLMPYIFAQAIDCHRHGLPLLRAMVLEFPADRTCQTLDDQYMLGESLLVAPIFNDDGICEYYVPAGTWTGLLDGKKRVGPAWVTETFDNLHLPVLVRQGHAILVGRSDRPDYDWAASLAKIVVGSAESDGVIKVPVPAAEKPGELAGHVNVRVSRGGLEVETTGDVKQPEAMVLSEQAHL